MKSESKKVSSRKFRFLLMGMLLTCFAVLILSIAKISTATSEKRKVQNSIFAGGVDPALPLQIDVRDGTPRGLGALSLTTAQQIALNSLQSAFGNSLNIRYNGLTATPMNISNPRGYLTAPSSAAPEQIARDFISQWREIFRFDDSDLNNLRLISRATSEEGITVLLFEQQANGLPVYHGEVLANVNRAGQLINVGGDSFPRLNVTNAAAISPADAITTAANSLGVSGFTAISLGSTKILATFGDLSPKYAAGTKFARSVFGDDISVQKIVFPFGAEGRVAYQFNLVTPQYQGIMWENIVDAQTGEILRRISLTASQTGGGNSIPRLGTFRPDVQNMVESHGSPSGAKGKVFDTMPVTMSGVPLSTDATGTNSTRAVRTGTYPNYTITRPNYASEAVLSNHFRYSIYAARNENPLPFTLTSLPQPLTPLLFGQVTRNFPDATYPSASSPFGWFYLPTGTGGQQISTADNNRAATQVTGYTMSPEAQTRNLAVNSPNGDGLQPFAADLTTLGSSVTLPDGRVLSSVYQSKYTEGNNVTVSDDHQNDNATTRGVRGYSSSRQFTDSRFDYYGEYEFGGVDATGGGTGSTTPVSYPASANPDVYPDTVSLFNLNNVEHDYLYSIGFTEPFWNFQFDNFGKGGAGGDGIDAEVQDGSGTDNANMSTPADGSSPRMQMYLFTDSGFRRSDGDLDWDVVAHEHYHGVSNRSAAKGRSSCLGTPLVGESGGMGEGWSDAIASSMSDDDGEGEYVTGYGDIAIRRLPYTNYRWSYGSINDRILNVRRLGSNAISLPPTPDNNAAGIPFEVHDVGEVWAATLWDVRELMIMKDPNGIFFDGSRRLGSGSTFYIGSRAVQSVDAFHPIDYRASFGDSMTPAPPSTSPQRATINAANIVRPKMLAQEIAATGNRNGPLATAVSNGARLADKIVLRSLQMAPCNPTFVDMRDSMLAADREISGGENLAILWRAFASHGVGVNATSTGKTNGIGQQGAVAAIVEDFDVPQDVLNCETLGPLPAPNFNLTNSTDNTVTVTISPVSGAVNYIVARATSATGPFTTIGTTTGTTFTDNDGGAGLVKNQTYYYEVHAARSQYCVGLGNVDSIKITVGVALSPAPIFGGLGQVADLKTGRSLVLSWSPATSGNPGANIVYDVYRVLNVDSDDDKTEPTFTPSASNRIAQDITGTSYTDANLTLGQQYYYIVQARDTTNSKLDTNGAGNTKTKFNAPSTKAVSLTVPFALETFDNPATANSRFVVPLTESGNTPDRSSMMFQRVNADLNGGGSNENAQADAPAAVTGLMFAPDYDPGNAGQGGPSDFTAEINPTNLTRSSFLEFDHRFSTEATFDGGNLEISLGAPSQVIGTVPDNIHTFDLNDYIVQNGYNGNLDGTLEGAAQGSILQGRRSFTGTSTLSHVKVALGDFAPNGGVKNPQNLPVYIVFRMTSDAGTFADGWYIDNLVVNNFNGAGLEGDVNNRPNGDGAVNAGDITIMRGFAAGQSQPDMSGATSEYQRADCAPRPTLGGGGPINAGDLTVARAYAADTSQQQFAGGPTSPSGEFRPLFNDEIKSAQSLILSGLLAKQKGRGAIKVGDSSAKLLASNLGSAAPTVMPVLVTRSGNTLTIGLVLNSNPAQVNAVGFSLNYNTAQVSNPTNVRLGNATASNNSTATLTPTNNPGQLGILLDLPPGQTYNTGNQQLVLVDFTVASGATQADFTFGDTPTQRYISQVGTGNQLNDASSFPPATITFAPTAATVSICGRVIARSVFYSPFRTLVTLTDQSGQSQTTYTLRSGDFCFEDVESGRTYILIARSKGNRYAPIVVNATENLSGIVFTPLE